MSLESVTRALSSHQQVLVAFSGGLDSTVLLHLLVEWRELSPGRCLRAIHIHHGLSAHADSWVEHCQQVCADLNVPLEVVRVTLNDVGLGVEAHARQARYDAFRAALQSHEVLVTAQHLDDQCETFLLALKRGSGPAGLSAMAEESAFHGTKLIRPLLAQSRDELETWARDRQLNWIEDESNQDDGYDRNFLRLRVLPLMTQRWPHFARAAARSAELCGEQEQLLGELLADELASLCGGEGQLSLNPLLEMSTAKRGALLRRWLTQHQAVMPSREMLERIWQEVALAREDANPQLRLGDYEVRRYQQQLWWVRREETETRVRLHWADAREPLELGNGDTLVLVNGTQIRRPKGDEDVSVRYAASGTFHIVGRNGGRKLKKSGRSWALRRGFGKPRRCCFMVRR
jgi:tRNA(Ile)-lysidine synthetase, N-terminal domain